MAERVTTKSDLVEEEGVQSGTQLIIAALLLVAFLICAYLSTLIPGRTLRLSLTILSGAAAFASFVWGILAVFRIQKARAVEAVTVNCPYCDYPMQFLAPPTEDYDCEGCHRRVQYENGVQVPIKRITCAFCKTVHKVSANAKTYTCDVCNRALKLTEGPAGAPAVAAGDRSDIFVNYDVVLTDVGRRPNEVAMALESILICNLAEARRQMANLPLTVLRNVPERKADAVRRRLRELGATAVIRPTEGAEQVAGRR